MRIDDLNPVPLGDLLDDLQHGECRFDPELHTGPDAFTIEPLMDRMAREDAAGEVCASCPVIDSCLEFALRTNPKNGIWAGLPAAQLHTLSTSAHKLGEVA
ncbi:WhiB family transcriptional regulator [Actinomadura sp. HBU206391]|uniref:WhiB family transcriptional regulator n=1 Tax=Actinomadura sp. HBU206391 TaxID=2731692 RepID=UPI0016509CF1|nr:WhiB family transcriptional regulator [Actinomadura sp. HBU206391]MBC6461469.1 WhiB family transcriptional regulator [Actinomadura sp. HBU206391]